MKPEITFTPIDLGTWKRREQFYYFSTMAPTGYSLTVEIDVTHFLRVLNERRLKFFPAYLWLVTKALSEQEEFKIAKKEDTLGVYNVLTPLYAAFHDDDKTFSLMWTLYDDDFPAFYEDYRNSQTTHGANHGILSQKDALPPPNAYTVSCVPWVNFTHFSVHTYENKPYFFPSVEAGRFMERDGKTYLPLSLTCHHATTDGYHVQEFLKTLRVYMDTFEAFCL